MCVTRKIIEILFGNYEKYYYLCSILDKQDVQRYNSAKWTKKEFKKEQRRQLMKMLETYGVVFPPDLIDELLCKINEIDRELKKK